MKARNVVLVIIYILFQCGCVPTHRRSIEGIYRGYNSSDLYTVFDKFIKDKGFIFIGKAEKPTTYKIASFYSKFDYSIHKDIAAVILLRDVENKQIGSAVEFVIAVEGDGSDKPTIITIDNEFEGFFPELLEQMDKSKLEVIKKS